MITKYGKSVEGIRKHKQKFIDDNELLLNEQHVCAQIYKKQPIRSQCKMCHAPLSEGVHFLSHDVEYVLCNKCGHVSGTHEETKEYSKYLYEDSSYGSYMYTEDENEGEKYNQRIEDIYLPKAAFLQEVLEQEKVEKKDVCILDIGAGAGYFVSACDDIGLYACGVDVSKDQVKFGNIFLHSQNCNSSLVTINENELEGCILESEARVISAIGVIEHLVDFHSVFEAIRANRSIEYVYMMVPMFGLSNILEMIFPDVYNRHLGGVHTHVFSEKSIQYLCRQYDMEIIAKWQFGTDMMDLFRMCMVKGDEDIRQIIQEKFWPCLDKMQLVLDQSGFCSEIHVVMKKKAK